MTEILLKNFMYRLSHHKSTLESFIVLNVVIIIIIIRNQKHIKSQKSTFLNTWNVAGLILSYSCSMACSAVRGGLWHPYPTKSTLMSDQCFLNSSLTDENKLFPLSSCHYWAYHLWRLFNKKVSDRAATAVATQSSLIFHFYSGCIALICI